MDGLVRLMEDAGFEDVHVTREDLSREEDVGEFQSYVSDRYRTSQLLAIPDHAYTGGLQRLREAVAGAAGEPLVAHSEFVRVTLRGNKPPA